MPASRAPRQQQPGVIEERSMDEQTQRETNDAPPAGEAPDAPVRRTPPGLAPMQVRESDLE
ncbi:MAG TPA: hypothetical protein VFY16_03360, partial [Gemmatimonadaceae bacterium]|nr:hypothetical protein [Gemmatimonadaceae bacterium]